MPSQVTGIVSAAAGPTHFLAVTPPQSTDIVVLESPKGPVLADVGETVELRASVVNASRIQWLLNGQVLMGRTNPVLTLPSVGLADAGTYQLLVENDTQAILASPATVVVVPVGYPQVRVNGRQILSSTRQGDSAEVLLSTSLPNGQLFYTLDGMEPSLDSVPYTGPFKVTNSVVVRAYALSGDFTQEASTEPVSIQIVPTHVVATAVIGRGRVERMPALERYLEDDVVTVKAVPETGWRFVRWEEDLAGAFPERNVATGRDNLVRAVFQLVPKYSVGFRASGGSIERNKGFDVAGQWDFDGGNLDASVGQPLAYLTPTVQSKTRFGIAGEGDLAGIPPMHGGLAKVMEVPGDLSREIGYVMTHGIAPNGGGARVNQYTLLMDVLVDTSGPPAAALWQTSSSNNTDDADLFWQGNNFGQGGGGYNGKGTFTAGEWHRVIAAYDMAANPPVVAKYVDGILQDEWTTNQGLDAGRRSLAPTALLFADGDQDERRRMWVNSIQIRDGAISRQEAESLGGPEASGIPLRSEFAEGTALRLAALPETGWSFLGWNGDYRGTEADFSWVVDGPAVFEAKFGTTLRTLAVGPGRIILDPELSVYPYGTQVKVIPVPNPGNTLALWGEAGAGQPKTEWLLTVTNAQPRVTALFRALTSDKVALTVQSTLGGRIQQPNADDVYAKGSVVTLTAVSDAGYEFVGWTGSASSTAIDVTLTLDTSKTMRAEFRRSGVVSHPLTVLITGPGAVRRVPDQGAYETGSEVELVAEPAANSQFSKWDGAVNSTQR